MWGEIEPPVKTRTSPRESEENGKVPEEPVTRSQRCYSGSPAETKQPPHDDPAREAAAAPILLPHNASTRRPRSVVVGNTVAVPLY